MPPTDPWNEALVVATVIGAFPAAAGVFVSIRGSFRWARSKWRGWIFRIEKRAVDKADEARKLADGLKKAELEAEQRRIKHAEADAKQEQYNQITLGLQKEFATMAQTIVTTVEEHVHKAVSSANDEQKQQLSSLHNWAIEHDLKDDKRFEKNDEANARIEASQVEVIERLERIENGVKNGQH